MLNPILNNLFNILCFHRLNLFILALTKGFFLVDLNVKSLDKNRIFASCKLKMIKLIKLTFFCCSFNRFIEFSILISWGLGRQYNEYLFGLLIVFLRCFIVQTRIQFIIVAQCNPNLIFLSHTIGFIFFVSASSNLSTILCATKFKNRQLVFCFYNFLAILAYLLDCVVFFTQNSILFLRVKVKICFGSVRIDYCSQYLYIRYLKLP